MAGKDIKARIINKHDTEANWSLATNFTPKQGEIIVYDVDATYAYERFKIGDGVTNVNSLPFVTMGSIETASSGSSNKNKWIKFASITLPSAWDCCSGVFNFAKAEGSYGAEGFLSYYFRNGSSTASTDVSLSWISLNSKDWADCVAAVQVSDGTFDLYYRPYKDYEAVVVTAMNTYNSSRLTFGVGDYVDTITAYEVSAVRSYAKSAGSAAMLQTYKPGSTTETYGEMYPLMAQWENENTLKLYSEDSITKVDYAETAGNVSKPKFTTVTLLAANWTGSDSPWSQVVTINGVTANSRIDFQLTVAQLTELQNSGIALMAENDNCVITVYAINNKPTSDYTIQATITEIEEVGA